MIDPQIAVGLLAAALALIFLGYQFKEGLTAWGGAVLLLILGLFVIAEGVGTDATEFTNTTVYNVTFNNTTNETIRTIERQINTTSTTSLVVPSRVTTPVGLVAVLLGIGVILSYGIDLLLPRRKRGLR